MVEERFEHVTVGVALHLVERDMGAVAHDLVEVIGGRLVLHVERDHLDGCLEVGSDAAEDVDHVEGEPEAGEADADGLEVPEAADESEAVEETAAEDGQPEDAAEPVEA